MINLPICWNNSLAFLNQFAGGTSGPITLPLTAPRNLSYADKRTPPEGVTYTWEAPERWGASGPTTTNRYQIDYVQSTDQNNATFLSDTPNIPLAIYVDVLTYSVIDTPVSGYISFRVRAINAAGDISHWTTTPVLDCATGAVPAPPPGGAFSSAFSTAFDV